MKRRALLSYWFSMIALLAVLDATAQHPVFRNYSVNDGLPSTECYTVIQDRQGYIWFGTDAGVARFDGYHFRTFTTENGLPDNTVFGVQEDSKGRIWFRTYSGKLAYFEDDSIHTIGANPAIEKIIGSSIMSSMWVDEHDTIWCGLSFSSNFYKIAPPWKETDFHQNAVQGKGIFVIAVGDKGVITGKTPAAPLENMSITYYDGTTVVSDTLIGPYAQSPRVYRRRNGNIIAGTESNLLEFGKAKGVIAHFDSTEHFIAVAEDHRGGIWLGTKWRGVQFIANGDLAHGKRTLYLDSVSVTGIFEDREGAFWFTTLEKGVYYLSSGNFLQYNLLRSQKEKVYSVNVDKNGAAWAGTFDGGLCKLTADSISCVFRAGVLNVVKDNFITGVQPLNNGKILVSGSTSFLYEPETKAIKTLFGMHDDTAQLVYFRKITVSPNGTVYLLNNYSLYRFDQQKELAIKLCPIPRIGISFAADRNEHIWVGCPDGLWEYTGTQVVYHGTDDPLLKNRIEDLAFAPDGSLWLATKGAGVLHKTSSGIERLRVDDGLVSNVCKALLTESDSTTWVGTNNGISRLSRRRGRWFIQNFSTRNGLPTNEINQLVRAGDYLWAATNHGVISFNVREASLNSTPPPVYITGILINGKTRSTVEQELRHDENYLVFNFVGLTYKDPGKTRYRYRLLGLDTNWSTTQNTSVQFTTLPPGNYTFVVYAQNNDGTESVLPATYHFFIRPPFWRTWWFVALVLALAALLVYFFIRFRDRQARRREALNRRIAGMEMKALRAQMNPHFIFNAINSIQHFILKENMDEAHKYLSKFSRLIRNVLENSKHELIPLSRELETLGIYIELETLRFSFGFSSTIDIDSGIDLNNTAIPPMLIQPYVENAIWHGLMHKEDKGHLHIGIRREGDFVRIEIDDNGIGREKSATLKSSRAADHKSMGMSVTQERLDLLAQLHRLQMRVDVIDKSENGIPKGTQVVVWIPFIPLH